MHSPKSTLEKIGPYTLVLSLLLFLGLCFGFYRYKVLKSDTASSTALYEMQIADLSTNLEALNNQNTSLKQSLSDAQNINAAFQGQIADISSSVGTLQKLKSLDPELLEKYSKVYFLNENFIPDSLSVIDPQYLYLSTKPLQIESNVKPFLEGMLAAAKTSNIPIEVISAFRSFDTQAALKSEYKVTYGTGANAFSADQGYSEHQLGTTVDLTTTKVADTFEGFDKTNAFAWLEGNAYRFGFILSYPDHNDYYEYEPWHWRFVGEKLALDLHNQGKNFYDLDQRTIDTYLINIFDNH